MSANDTTHYTVTITKAEQKQRLDKALGMILSDLSRSYIKQLIEQGHVTKEGTEHVSATYKTQLDDVYHITVPAPEEIEVVAQHIPLDIVFEDEHLLVINKQAGLTVHPGAGQHDGTLVNALLHHCKDSLSGIGGYLRPGIVHRLDKDTSGLMVAAKDDISHRALSEAIQTRTLKRHYLALVWGAPTPAAGLIDAPIDRHPKDRLKMHVCATGKGREARTNYHVLETFSDIASLVECKLDTGRTHQIRVHMHHIHTPIMGDTTYGGKRNLPKPVLALDNHQAISALSRQALHSYKIAFTHPITGKELAFERNLGSQHTEDIFEAYDILKHLK